MINLIKNGVYLLDRREILEDSPENKNRITQRCPEGKEAGRRGTMASAILDAHNTAADAAGGGTGTSAANDLLRLNFDAMASHDITFVNIVQTAKVSGLEQFPVPYILTNCHNSLCAVGGTINEDDHVFGLSAARRYGGIYVPPHLAVIHSYIRETQAGCGKMILGSDSHTRYGCLGTMGVGEGGGELVKQILRQTYDVPRPKVIAVYLSGKPRPGVGPQDVALCLIAAVFKDGFVKNSVLEFVGEGIKNLSMDYRAGIDVMTTETTCWSSIWETDDKVKDFLTMHGRGGEYKKLSPEKHAYYDGMIRIDLSRIKPAIALPFHPSNVFMIDDLLKTPGDILRTVEKEAAEIIEKPGLNLSLVDKLDDKGRLHLDQGIIAGCAGGTFDNIMAAASILRGGSPGDFSLSVYPGSQPVMLELAKNGAAADLIAGGAILRTAFCGPCFGAGDVPANNSLSIRHTTRNFPNREGSKPAEGQIAAAALMDARSIAATARNGGILCSAEDFAAAEPSVPYHFDESPYQTRVYNGFGKADKDAALRYGPNITDWPPFEAMGEDILLKIVSFITDPVTTTDELIPSGDTSSYRSNPIGLAEYTLSRKDPGYVGRAKAVREKNLPELPAIYEQIRRIKGMEKINTAKIQLGSAIFAKKPGDGSAREQAASCQRVLGGLANFALEYATKRYRSNLINWGILPFTIEIEKEIPFENGNYVFIPGIAKSIREKSLPGDTAVTAYVLRESGDAKSFTVKLPEFSAVENEIIRDGCLINYNRRLLEEKKN
ncbi:hydratase [Spirochaetia bacterium]|nr:hydratase [Spirochaetia bacterium]